MGFGGRFNKLFGLGKKDDDELKPQNNDNEREDNDFSEDNLNIDSEIENPTENRNFKYLDDLIHSGKNEIVLDSDIFLDEEEESEYLNGIKIDVGDITINGNGHIVDAKGKTRIFETNGKNIILKNIILKNGFTESRGGAIFNTGHGILAINDCLLHENISKRHGGAIFNSGGSELTITQSSLNENTANNDGGAINNNGTLTIMQSTINENTANNDGGAIDNNGILEIIESVFNENTANNGGGAINNNGDLVIRLSSFGENITKEESGGAINNNGNLTIIESILNENTANNGGGAINNEWSKLTIEKSILNENTANNDGGAINNYEGNFKIFNCEMSKNNSPNNIICNNDLLMMWDTNFYENQSTHMIFSHEKANLSIFSGEFIDNGVTESVILNDGKSCTIEKTIFDNIHGANIINRTDLTLKSPIIKNDGQSIINEGHILIRESSQGIFSKINSEKGIINSDMVELEEEKFDFGYLDRKIHESDIKEIILDKDICFEDYERDFYEGGIELDIDDLVIDGNGYAIDGKNKSRIFLITGNNIKLKNIRFKNGRSHRNHDNRINNNGGAIKNNYNNKLTIENCEFLNNTSEEEGGAIHNKRGDLIIYGSAFRENTAMERTGGAIHNGGMLQVCGSIFNKNEVIGTDFFGGNGAAFYNEGELLITESEICENIARSNGGAIINKGALKITKSKLNANTAKKHGGAIVNGGMLTIKGSTLSENTANSNGGAINNMWDTLKITDCIICENTANGNGGGIYSSGNSKHELINCRVENNLPDNIFEDNE